MHRLRLLATDSLINLLPGAALLITLKTAIISFHLPTLDTVFYGTVLGAFPCQLAIYAYFIRIPPILRSRE